MLAWAGLELNFIPVAGMGLFWICAGVSVGDPGMFSVLVSTVPMFSGLAQYQGLFCSSYDPTGRSLGSKRVWETSGVWEGVPSWPQACPTPQGAVTWELLLRDWLDTSWLVVGGCYHLQNFFLGFNSLGFVLFLFIAIYSFILAIL